MSIASREGVHRHRRSTEREQKHVEVTGARPSRERLAEPWATLPSSWQNEFLTARCKLGFHHRRLAPAPVAPALTPGTGPPPNPAGP